MMSLLIFFGVCGVFALARNYVSTNWFANWFAKSIEVEAASRPQKSLTRNCGEILAKTGPLRTTNKNDTNFHHFIKIEDLEDGTDVGGFHLRVAKLEAETYTPAALGSPGGSTKGKNFECLTVPGARASGPLVVRQVRTYKVFADVVAINEWEFEIRFYEPSAIGAKIGGFYHPRGTPHTVWNIKNPTPPALSRINISRKSTVKENVFYEFFYDEARDAWESRKDGQLTASKTSEVNLQNPCERVETLLSYENGRVEKKLKYYQAFPWGQKIVKVILDPDGKAATTEFTYFEDPNDRRYSWRKTVKSPDGTVREENE